MLITLLSQKWIENYSAPNPINYRAGCACARSSWSTFYSELLRPDVFLSKLKETFVTLMRKIAERPVFDRFIRPGPEVASMVMTLKMMVLVTVMMMLVMATLAMWDLWGLWGLRDLWDLWYLW